MINLSTRKREGEWSFGVCVWRIFGHDDFVEAATIYFWRWVISVYW